MDGYEKRCGIICFEMPNLSASDGKASSTRWFVTTTTSTRMEMGENNNGFCDGTSEGTEET